MSKYSNEILEQFSQSADEIWSVSREIWSHPELPLEETYSSQVLRTYLEKHGFSIEAGVSGMPTAFIASKGSGEPIIGLLGEYDALPDMSQDLVAVREPLVQGGPGHACGHNLLGTGMAAAAVVVSEIMEQHGLPGTVRFYGCPAEEIMYGKIKMDADHVFDSNDVCLSWHPMTVNCVSNFSYAAMTSIRFNFKGISSHAAESPEQGRSALDAVELMNVGANFMREHMIQEARIHYVISNGGGRPNVVPATAQSWYYVRAPYRHQVDALLERLINISKGAAMMTDTETSYEIESGCYNTVLNHTLNRILYDSMQSIPGQQWDKADYDLAAELQKPVDPQALANTMRTFHATQLQGEVLHSGVLPLKEEIAYLRGSTDISNVSKSVPMAQVFTCCVPVGMPGHTWQTVVSAGGEIGRKGMMYAAEVIADASLYLLDNPAAVREAKEEFQKTKM